MPSFSVHLERTSSWVCRGGVDCKGGNSLEGSCRLRGGRDCGGERRQEKTLLSSRGGCSCSAGVALPSHPCSASPLLGTSACFRHRTRLREVHGLQALCLPPTGTRGDRHPELGLQSELLEWQSGGPKHKLMGPVVWRGFCPFHRFLGPPLSGPFFWHQVPYPSPWTNFMASQGGEARPFQGSTHLCLPAGASPAALSLPRCSSVSHTRLQTPGAQALCLRPSAPALDRFQGSERVSPKEWHLN